MSAMAKRFPWGLTITTVVAFAILVSLGVWQLYRLQWKEGVLAQRAALEHAPARPLAEVLASSSDVAALDMVRVTLQCPGLASAPTERLYSLADGKVVNRLISLCRLDHQPYAAILVDRGRVPQEITAPPVIDPADQAPVTITGVLRKEPRPNFITRLITPKTPPPAPGKTRLWMTYDLPAIGAALGSPNAAPIFVAAETSSNPDWAQLTPGLSTEPIPNNHLQYAFTWFGLAMVLLFIYAAMLRKRLNQP